MSKKIPKISIVVPCFNEDQLIANSIDSLKKIVNSLIDQKKIRKNSYIMLVDDGSYDSTWKIIMNAIDRSILVKGIKLAKNVGHQNALLAGLSVVNNNCDCTISIDADMQQDETAIPEFIDKYKNGADIVFGVRKDRNSDSFFKKHTANIFYNAMKRMGTNTIINHADYRLFSHKSLNALLQYKESNLFLRGIVANLGFKTDCVYFETRKRTVGKSKYPFRKMMAFALDGITSFSVIPLRLITLLGFIIFIFSIAMGIYALIQQMSGHNVAVGWASTVIPIYFIGGIQLLCFGIMGEYIGKIYQETKRRPRYIIEEKIL